ncbi:hypothetical protein GIB67_041993 [Kingdonia uniflora]|uniref:NAB domain-containing protein n=1 Tax=Kingdonia uniflora TaxID=39325 RepID=A0A7J7P009_9MAGN|nr:hypothetical protein GIB67_041993 [Kingdonia uniflora]
MYYKKKPELVKIVEELHRSFCALAERFDPSRSDSIRVTRLGSSSSSSNSFGSSNQTKLETPNLHPKSIIEDPNTEGNASKFGVEYINKMPHDVNSPEPKVTALQTGVELPILTLGKEKRSPDVKFQVSKLVEDNLRQQDKLIKRNDEKREVIKDLCIQLLKILNGIMDV